MAEIKYKKNLKQKMDDRFNGFNYWMWLIFFICVAGFVIEEHGWPIGIFIFILMAVVLELSYQLSNR